MAKKEIRIQTIKRMLSVAKSLATNETSEIYELAHYIADNALNKICMLVGIESNKALVYKNPKDKRKTTRRFNLLYKDILEQNYNVPQYDDLIKNYHRDRNTYNHEIGSLDSTMRKPIAENYIKCVEDIMRKVGFLKQDEIIEPFSLTLVDLSRKNDLTSKFQNLYNRLKSKNLEHIRLDIKTILEDIGVRDLQRILKMEYSENNERIMLVDPSNWNLSIHSGSILYLRLIKYVNGNSLTYDFEIPSENEDILHEFLDLIQNRCKQYGIF